MLCGVLSVFVVLKRMAFIGQGISHAAFGGVGFALLVGVFASAVRGPMARDVIIAAFCVATALVIGLIARRGRVAEDTAIGIILVAGMALGVLLLDIRSLGWAGYTPPVHDILFGDLLFLRTVEIAAVWVLAGVVCVMTVSFFKELVFFIFDEETAQAFGVRTGVLYYGLLVFLALAVVAAMRTLGVILASALLILPGASARRLSRRIGRIVMLSGFIGVAGVTGGFFLTILLQEVTFGAVIVFVLCGIFAACCLWDKLSRSIVRRWAGHGGA